MLWNVNGIINKLDDCDFVNFISDFDVLLFTETWNSRLSKIDLNGFKFFSCPRPKYNRSAKRNSGGLIIYYKEIYHRHIQLVSINNDGIVWLKLSRDFTGSEHDVYFCVCYIPPENSSVYSNVNSPMYNRDYFDVLNNDICRYSEKGIVFLTGDLNARTGLLHDQISDIKLNRFVDLPSTDESSLIIQSRKNHDLVVNQFGHKLLNLCKSNNMCIANGRLEEGKYTFNSLHKNKPIASTVDYVITPRQHLHVIQNMCVLDMNEFSDHNPIVFTMSYNYPNNPNTSDSSFSVNKLVWDREKKNTLLNSLVENKNLFDDVSVKIQSGEYNINQCIEQFSSIIHDVSFPIFGKSYTPNKSALANKKKNEWFTHECRSAKNVFYEAKRQYNNCQSERNKISFLNARASFVKLKRKARAGYYCKEGAKLSSMSKTSPRKFWKYINKYKSSHSCPGNVGLDDFVKHFEKSSNTAHSVFNSDAPSFQNENTLQINELDEPITIEEIVKTIKHLKRNKSCDLDGNVADFFIDAIDFISPYLCVIFNKIFDTGIYPELWAKGAIIPIFKKGDASSPSNYRGITIINVVAKIFSLLLRNRINKWAENENVFNDCQFGFRDNRSTTDAIFILHCLIQKVLQKNEKLWCIFIDYERAFDTVIRDALWVKLVQTGLSCKMLNILKSIYSDVKSCVKLSTQMNMSEFFNVSLGLKQGEPLSPLLFILFINDITSVIDFNSLNETDLELLSRYLILFADDIVLFSTSPITLQTHINNIYEYSCKWGLKINVNKTKICIFEKRKRVHDVTFYINDEIIEIVNSFVYLGIVFTSNGSLNGSVKALSEQAIKAYHNLIAVFNKVKLDIKTKFYLFDSLIVPILLYGSEIWGVYEFKEIDKLHIKFCKRILGVSNQTPNLAVLGELGRFPLYVIAKERSLKFWLKIIENPDSQLSHIYNDQCKIENNSFWSSKLNNIIDKLGFSCLRQNVYTNQSPNYYFQLKQRLRDQFIQEWRMSIDGMSKLFYYSRFKSNFEISEYILKLDNDKSRQTFAKFRLSSHPLEIETGRLKNIPRENRLCKMCIFNQIESEYHFLLCCPKYSVIRTKYLGSIPWPCIGKFNSLMATSNKRTLIKVVNFLKEAFSLRKELHV